MCPLPLVIWFSALEATPVAATLFLLEHCCWAWCAGSSLLLFAVGAASLLLWVVGTSDLLFLLWGAGSCGLSSAVVWLWVQPSFLLWGDCCFSQTMTYFFGLWPPLVRVLSTEVLCEGLSVSPTVCVRVWLCEVFVTLSPWWQESSFISWQEIQPIWWIYELDFVWA